MQLPRRNLDCDLWQSKSDRATQGHIPTSQLQHSQLRVSSSHSTTTDSPRCAPQFPFTNRLTTIIYSASLVLAWLSRRRLRAAHSHSIVQGFISESLIFAAKHPYCQSNFILVYLEAEESNLWISNTPHVDSCQFQSFMHSTVEVTFDICYGEECS